MTAMLPACRTGLFENVDVKVIPNHKTNKSTVRFIFKEKIWPEMESFKVAPSGTYIPSLQTKRSRSTLAAARTSASIEHMAFKVLKYVAVAQVQNRFRQVPIRFDRFRQ